MTKHRWSVHRVCGDQSGTSWRARKILRKFLAGRRARVLASPYQSSKVPIHVLLNGPRHPYGVGVGVSLNGAKPVYRS